jgi:hypothetical protein
VLLCWASLAAAAASQAPVPAAGAGPASGSDSDPIACWWKTSTSAVHVGEQFTLTLTCGLVETEAGRVVTDTDRLDPAALDVAPFEVISGTRHRDVEAPPRRYLQYSYTVRLLADELFGRDVDIPSVAITYNIETFGATAARGRDQVYLLPALPMRILSLVPITATDIQDASPDSFADIDRRAFRATGEIGAAAALFAFAAVFIVMSAVRFARPRVAVAAVDVAALPPAVVLRSCSREAARLKSEVAGGGWTLDRVDTALAVFRIAASVALGRSVAQRVVDEDVVPQEGQLRVRKSALSSQRVLISGATTASAVAARLEERGAGRIDPRLRVTLEELGDALAAFAGARYARADTLDSSALDAALEAGMRAVARLQMLKRWPARAADAASRAAEHLRGLAWNR